MSREERTDKKRRSLRLRGLGLCGVDDSVDPRLLALISRDYPFVEWGALFGADLLEGTPRYASSKWVQTLAKVQAALPAAQRMRLAAHLCGARAEEVLNGNATFAKQMFAAGFRRFQVGHHD